MCCIIVVVCVKQQQEVQVVYLQYHNKSSLFAAHSVYIEMNAGCQFFSSLLASVM